MIKGLIVAAVQVALVLSIAAKFEMDRSSLPRVWVKTAPFDPNLPIRGRYVRLALSIEGRGFSSGEIYGPARLSVEGGNLVAKPAEDGTVMIITNGDRIRLAEPVAFFIPEHAQDPSIRPAGEELWVEVTIPKKGPPRPIRLGVKKNGVLTPLDLN